jgi:hypothetical protein
MNLCPKGEFLLLVSDLLLTVWVTEPCHHRPHHIMDRLPVVLRCVKNLHIVWVCIFTVCASRNACCISTCAHKSHQACKLFELVLPCTAHISDEGVHLAQCGKGSWVPSLEVGNPLSDLAGGAVCRTVVWPSGRLQDGVQRRLYAFGAALPLSEMSCSLWQTWWCLCGACFVSHRSGIGLAFDCWGVICVRLVGSWVLLPCICGKVCRDMSARCEEWRS